MGEALSCLYCDAPMSGQALIAVIPHWEGVGAQQRETTISMCQGNEGGLSCLKVLSIQSERLPYPIAAEQRHSNIIYQITMELLDFTSIKMM